MKLYSLSEVGELIDILRDKYASDFHSVVDEDETLASAYLEKMRKCDDAIEILEILAYNDVMESFKNFRNRRTNELPF